VHEAARKILAVALLATRAYLCGAADDIDSSISALIGKADYLTRYFMERFVTRRRRRRNDRSHSSENMKRLKEITCGVK